MGPRAQAKKRRWQKVTSELFQPTAPPPDDSAYYADTDTSAEDEAERAEERDLLSSIRSIRDFIHAQPYIPTLQHIPPFYPTNAIPHLPYLDPNTIMNSSAYTQRQGQPRLQNASKSGLGNGLVGAGGGGWGAGLGGAGGGLGYGGVGGLGGGLGATQRLAPALSGFAQVMGGGSNQGLDMR
jgi:hypothetical protein